MKQTDNSEMVLRFHLGFENTEERFSLLTNFLRRTGIHRVILFSAPFVETEEVLPENYYRKHAEMLVPFIEQLRQLNVEVGINMMYTIGHCFYSGEAGFRRAVTIDGKPSNGCICMQDERLWEYIKTVYGYYAALHPAVIFADDDIRSLSLGQLTCFCEKHLMLIGQRADDYSPFNALKETLLGSGYPNERVKEAYFTQVQEDINHIFEIIADSVHAISPETEIGIMTTSYPFITLDRDLNSFFKKYRTSRKITRIRTGMNFYREGAITEIPKQFYQQAIQRNFINDERVEIQPEVENDTYGLYQKSNSVTRLQLVWCLTNGFRNMQLNLFDFVDYPVENYEEITGMLVDSSAYRNRIAAQIPEGHRTDGISVYAHPRAAWNNHGKLPDLSNWYSWLQLMGLPLSTQSDSSDFVMLTGGEIAAATDAEIDGLLKKGAVVDLTSAQILVQRGFGERIGIRSIESLTENYVGERFTQDELNGEFKGCHNSHYFNPSLIDREHVAKITYYPGAQPASYIINLRKEEIANGAVRYENRFGERFLLIPVADDGTFVFFTNMNRKRRRQLIHAWEWISGKELPVRAENERMCVNINRFDGCNVISLFNLSCDAVSEPIVVYRPRGRLTYLNQMGEKMELPYTAKGNRLVLQKEMKALDTLIIVDEVSDTWRV